MRCLLRHVLLAVAAQSTTAVSAIMGKDALHRVNALCAPQDNPSDCTALVNLYWATGSKLNFTMDSRTPLCTWAGITCNATTSGRVVKV
jgi:hypothetical protein